MDFLQDYLPQAYALYSTYSTTYSPYILPIYRAILYTQSFFYRTIYPLLYPFYTFIYNITTNSSSSSATSPFNPRDFISLLLLALVLFITLRVLDYMRKTVIYWISLAIRLTFWLAVFATVFYVYQRGLDKSIEDFGWVWGLLEGLGEEGERVGGRKARNRDREARRVRSAAAAAGPGAHGQRGRTRGGGW